MLAQIKKIVLLGTHQSLTDDQNRRLMYTNIVYVTLPIVYIIFVIIDIEAYLKPVGVLQWDQFIFVLEIAICVFSLYLNKLGYSLAGRLLFILSWPLLMHIIPIWHQQTPSDYYFAYPVGLIFHALLIHLMFSRKREPKVYWPLIVLNFILIVTSIQFLLINEDASSEELLAVVNNKYFFLVIVLYYLLFSLLIFLIIQSIENLFVDISTAKEIIQEQKEEVTAINEELTKSNEALSKLNEHVLLLNQNLEDTILKRTEELAQKNDRLTEYAFYNAHKLRSPFCRIKGLQYLKTISTPEDQVYLDTLIEKEMKDLDTIISEIQKIVSE